MSENVPKTCRVMDLLGMVMLMTTAVCLVTSLNTDDFVMQGIFLQRALDSFAISVIAFGVSRICELGRLVFLQHVHAASLRSYLNHKFHRLARQ